MFQCSALVLCHIIMQFQGIETSVLSMHSQLCPPHFHAQLAIPNSFLCIASHAHLLSVHSYTHDHLLSMHSQSCPPPFYAQLPMPTSFQCIDTHAYLLSMHSYLCPPPLIYAQLPVPTSFLCIDTYACNLSRCCNLVSFFNLNSTLAKTQGSLYVHSGKQLIRY